MDSFPVEAMHLGTPLAEYGMVAQRTALLAGPLVAAIGLCAAGFALTSGVREEMLVFTIIGLVLAAVGGYLLFSTLRARDLRAWLFTDGLAYRERGQMRVIRWDEIGWVWQRITRRYVNGVPVGTDYRYTLQRLDGEKFTLNPRLAKIGELGNHLQQELFRRLFPQAVEAYNSGQELSFGKLSLSRAGISNGKETLPWEQVKGVKLENGQIVVSKQGKWLAWGGTPAHEVPNLFILLEIIHQVVGLR